MASKGNLFLDNDVAIGMYDAVKAYECKVQDALYSQYKTAYKISASNYFRGDAADSFKNYLTNGTVNIISELLDISSDMTMISQLLAESFYQYEHNHLGRVEESVLDYIGKVFNSKEGIYDSAKNELNAVLRLASKYISTKDLSLGTVNDGYTRAKRTVEQIRMDLYAIDDETLKTVDELMVRIIEIRTFIEQIKDYCYNSDGKINVDKLNTIQSQGWFHTAGNLTLYLLLQEDPFKYASGEVTLSEDQWAVGLCSDVYAYAGYSFLTATGEAGTEGRTAFANGKAKVLQANGYAQFTDYLNTSANLNIAYAEGEAKIGLSHDYVGFKVDAKVGIIQADGSLVIGSEDVNAFVKGEVKVLCANGKAVFEFEDDGVFAVGVDVSAALASVSVKGGTTILGYKNKDTATGETETLLGFKIGAKAKAGGSFAILAESKTAIEGEHLNINAATLKIDAAALLGIDATVTIPTLFLKW